MKMETTLPTSEQVVKAKQKNPWDFSNKILYDLCRDNFSHTQVDATLTKVLFIGRIYSAAVERRKNKDDEIGDDFYFNKIEPSFRKPFLDENLKELCQFRNLTIDNIPGVLRTHNDLLKELHTITKLDKRSFCSKYLHFHMPELFFIFDSRVQSAVRGFISKVPKDLRHILDDDKNIDKEYATFFCKSFELKRQIEARYNITLTNRQLDNVLIEVANNIAITNKHKTQFT